MELLFNNTFFLHGFLYLQVIQKVMARNVYSQ